jgi:hypothetical protein
MDLVLEKLPSILAKISASAFLISCIFLIGVTAGGLTEIRSLLIVSLALFGLWVAIAFFVGVMALVAAIWFLI